MASVPTIPPLLISFAGAAPAIFRERRQEIQIGAQTLGRRADAGVPERLFAAPGAAQIHRHEEVVSGPRVKARDQMFCPSQNRRGKKRGASLGHRRVPADDRHAVGLRSRAHAFPDLPGLVETGSPEHIDDRQRPPAHRSDVAEIHHHRRIPREPRVVCDERRQHPFRGEEQPTVAIRDRRAIVAQPRLAGQLDAGS